jgi:NAD+ synthetase
MARKCNGIVISTGQRSEDEYMNFFTLHGDVGDISPIFSVGKGFELPIIASSLGIREDIIFQPPSDGLQVTEDNTDEAQLGANYKEVDTIMSIYLNQLPVSIELKDKLKANLFNLRETDVDGFEKVNKIINRHETFKFKSKGPYNFTREQVGLL